ncbi:MAG: flagellar biosynthesis anti-sigma factor FlgM [Spirochaetes bacterium]|nr:flagellar biosynthesis anti-sigma factor FlgM [Spirochaetota bacterium]
MNIDKINNAGHIQPVNDKASVKPAETQAASLGSDSVSISQAALQAREAAQVQKAVASASDVRADRVREVKEKLARGEYDNPSNEVLNHVAARLTTAIKG